jgi:acyl transferase domain-containing protein
MAIVGGANLLSDGKFRMHSYFRDLASEHDCRGYTAKNGLHISDCVGAVLLKPLAKAIADGDCVRAVIRSTHTCHIGGVDGKVVPNVEVLSREIAAGLRTSGIDARTISYVESATTGFKLGDEMEMAMLTEVFKQLTPDKQFCRLGTVKSNMGHAEAASGISQLIKVILQIDHGQLTPLLNLGPIDPQLDLSDTPFFLQTELTEWAQPEMKVNSTKRQHPRRALVNSLGLGGTFSNVLVEEHLSSVDCGVADDASAQVIVVSAKNRDRLQASCQQLLEFAVREPTINLSRFAYTLQIGRQEMAARAAFVASTVDELKVGLQACIAVLAGAPRVAFPVWVGECTEDGNRGNPNKDPSAPIVADITREDLAARWVGGAAIAWRQIYSSAPRKMVLPGYPFAQTRSTATIQLDY